MTGPLLAMVLAATQVVTVKLHEGAKVGALTLTFESMSIETIAPSPHEKNPVTTMAVSVSITVEEAGEKSTLELWLPSSKPTEWRGHRFRVKSTHDEYTKQPSVVLVVD